MGARRVTLLSAVQVLIDGMDEADADEVLAACELLGSLAARVRSTLRAQSGTYPAATALRVTLERQARRLRVGANEYLLSPRELSLVDYLQARAGQWVARDELLRAVFGTQTGYDPSLVRTHVLNIRKKLQEDDWLLRTDRLSGVMLVVAIDDAD